MQQEAYAQVARDRAQRLAMVYMFYAIFLIIDVKYHDDLHVTFI